MAEEKQYTLKHPFYLDLETGFIKGGTSTIETDDRYKNRFIPWLAEIPEGGRVDLESFQRQASQNALASSAEIADYEEFKKWRAAQTAAKATGTSEAKTSVTVGPISSQEPPSGNPNGQVPGSPEVNPIPPAMILTKEQRHDKIVSVMSDLTVNDMTKSLTNPMPSVNALNRLTGLTDIEGSEREKAWEEFRKANPDWKPRTEE